MEKKYVNNGRSSQSTVRAGVIAPHDIEHYVDQFYPDLLLDGDRCVPTEYAIAKYSTPIFA